jgi:peroxiredoxin
MNSPDTEHESRLRKYLPLFANVLLMVVFFAGVSAFQARNMLSTKQQPAPDLQVMTLQGAPYSLAEAASRPVLMYFFAPWCHFCAASADNIVRLRRLRSEEQLEIVMVALDWKDRAELQEYSKRHNLNVPVLLGDAKVARDWKVYAFPTYYVLNSDHAVAKRDIGYSTQLGLLWRSWSVD